MGAPPSAMKSEIREFTTGVAGVHRVSGVGGGHITGGPVSVPASAFPALPPVVPALPPVVPALPPVVPALPPVPAPPVPAPPVPPLPLVPAPPPAVPAPPPVVLPAAPAMPPVPPGLPGLSSSETQAPVTNHALESIRSPKRVI